MTGEQLPEGWAEVRIADVCAVNPRDDHLGDATEVTFVPMAAVSEVTGTIERPEVRKTQEVRKGFTSFVDDDVIFAKITPCMENGKSAVARGLVNGRGYGSTEFVVLRSKGGIDPSFLHRFVRRDVYRREARATMQSGVGQARVPKEFIENTTLMLPPLLEQKRIVARLDGLQARSRAAREALAEVPALLDTFRQSVLAAAFRGDLTAEWRARNPDVEPASRLIERIRAARKTRWEQANLTKKYVEPEPVDDSELPELPETWTWASLPELGEMSRGKSRHRPRNDQALYSGGIHPFIQTGDVARSGGKITGATSFYNDFGLSQSRLFPAGTVCITIAANIASTAVLGLAACFPDSVVGVTVDRRLVSPELLETYIRTVRADLERFAPATAQKNINLEVLSAVAVPVVPAAERAELERQLVSALGAVEAVARTLSDSCADLDTLDQSILARAFRGDLVDQDPNDEPAAALLARMKGATNGTGSEKGRKRRSPEAEP